jgi:hypothetical protein
MFVLLAIILLGILVLLAFVFPGELLLHILPSKFVLLAIFFLAGLCF